MASSEFPKAMKAAPNGVTQMESLAAPPASDEGYLQFTSSESEANTPLGVDPNMGFPQTDSGCENLDFLLHVDPALLDITQLGGVDFLMPDPSGSYPDVRATNVSMPEVPDLDIGATPVSLEPSSKGTKWTGEMETFFLERKRNGDTYVVIVSKMRDKFGVSLNPNILSKRFKSIAKLVSKNAVMNTALNNATPRIITVIEDEIKKLSTPGVSNLDESSKEMLRQLPGVLNNVAVDLWIQAQAAAHR